MLAVEMEAGTNPDLALVDVNNKVKAKVSDLPKDANEPVSMKFDINAQPFLIASFTMFRRVQLCAADDPDGLAALDTETPDAGFTAEDWDAALGEYWDEHDDLNDGPSARSPQLFIVEPQPGRHWLVRQIVDDPAGNHDWQITI